MTEADAGHTEFTDEVFQNQTRFPGGEWADAAEPFTDVVRPTHTYTHFIFVKNVSEDYRTKACLFMLGSIVNRFLLRYYALRKGGLPCG